MIDINEQPSKKLVRFSPNLERASRHTSRPTSSHTPFERHPPPLRGRGPREPREVASRLNRKETALPRVAAPLRTSSPSERSLAAHHRAVAEAESFEVRAATAVHPNSSAQTVRVRDGGAQAAWRELVVFPYGESGAFLEVWGSLSRDAILSSHVNESARVGISRDVIDHHHTHNEIARSLQHSRGAVTHTRSSLEVWDLARRHPHHHTHHEISRSLNRERATAARARARALRSSSRTTRRRRSCSRRSSATRSRCSGST